MNIVIICSTNFLIPTMTLIMTLPLCYLMCLMHWSILLVTSISQPCSCLFLRGTSSTYIVIKFTLTNSIFLKISAKLDVGNNRKADLCDNANAASNYGSFSLSSTHSPQARRHKDTTRQVTGAQVPPAGIQHRQLHTKIQRGLVEKMRSAWKYAVRGVNNERWFTLQEQRKMSGV